MLLWLVGLCFVRTSIISHHLHFGDLDILSSFAGAETDTVGPGFRGAVGQYAFDIEEEEP